MQEIVTKKHPRKKAVHVNLMENYKKDLIWKILNWHMQSMGYEVLG